MSVFPQPVDLLYKPLAEFQEELLPQEVPLRTIYNIYDEHEQNRESKLPSFKPLTHSLPNILLSA